MTWYKCDACGSCVCWCHPSEDWGIAESCMYDVGIPVNWRKARPPRPKVKKRDRSFLDMPSSNLDGVH